MAKLNKQMYYTANGEKKLNCFKINIPKELVKKAQLKENDDLIIIPEKNQLIIKRK